MKHERPYLLVDTNVWLASYIPSRHGHAAARSFFVESRTHGATLLYAVTTARDLFYLAGRELKRSLREQVGDLTEGDAAAIQRLSWSFVDNMRDMATAVGADEADLWRASKMRGVHGDLEDNLIRAAAERARADLIVTWDRGLLSKALMPTVTPPDALAWLAAQD